VAASVGDTSSVAQTSSHVATAARTVMDTASGRASVTWRTVAALLIAQVAQPRVVRVRWRVCARTRMGEVERERRRASGWQWWNGVARQERSARHSDRHSSSRLSVATAPASLVVKGGEMV